MLRRRRPSSRRSSRPRTHRRRRHTHKNIIFSMCMNVCMVAAMAAMPTRIL